MRIHSRWLLALLLSSACAKVSPPGGGPVDKTAPDVTRTQPLADATGVASDHVVRIDFSEPMDRRATEDAVFVTPASEIRMVWEQSAGLRLSFPHGLSIDRTYVVTVGTDARDLRRNRLHTAFQFAFSTGASLDQGLLVGRVVDLQGPRRGVTVWAYDLDHFGGRVGEDPPAYTTQTGSDGRFRFERLAPTRYRLFAYDDVDSDRKLADSEARAVGAADVDVAETDSTIAGDMRLASSAGAVHLERISAPDQDRLLLVFDKAVDPEDLEIDIADLEVLLVHAASDDPRRIHVRTRTQEPGRTYQPRLRVQGTEMTVEEPVRGSSRADTRPPELARQYPLGAAIQLSHLSFAFDEAMASHIPGPSFWAAADSASVLPPSGSWRWRDPLHLVYEWADTLKASSVRMTGVWQNVTDLAGNVPEEPVAVDIQILAAEDYPSVAGGLQLGPAVEHSAIRILAVSDDLTRSVDVAADSLRSTLPPGSYRIYGFADLNRNGQHDAGQVDPFRFAEPFGWLGTIDAKPSTTSRTDLRIQ